MTDKKFPGKHISLQEVLRPLVYKGRGAVSNLSGRFEQHRHADEDDGWGNLDADLEPLRTEVIIDSSRSIINWNTSPDIPFDRSINPYRGCEHGCIYCFARPSHTYLGWSAGLDFESKILVKPDAAKLLRKELSKRNYQCATMAMGTNTDPYQPLEKQQRLTRQILEVLAEFRHPVSIVTKSAMVERDMDILAPMAEQGLAQVFISITTLDNQISRTLEPRAAAPRRRLQTIERLHAAGIPVGVMTAPVIPVLTDTELETILKAAAEAGAMSAGYVLLRLPLEVSPLFEEWVQLHYPLKAAHVMSIIRQSREGKTNQAEFHERMRGSGPFANMIRQRFKLMTKKLGLNQRDMRMNTTLFSPPGKATQLDLF
ncbi:PA0069 family radical SAM protein [Methylobacillus caricis]|uniref:PA0069 family radical SAM protein n=1 Tax=Methylobacillus caricis TaxID=1971611 RepID=UPI001CFFBFDD|nr:PA0069 family radical SAM protein [Methylobacillus caricis]MCB5187706.1 PA0069 family radical SAM protein [Methylobacillus caricis]